MYICEPERPIKSELLDPRLIRHVVQKFARGFLQLCKGALRARPA